MDKEKIIEIAKTSIQKLMKGFSLSREYCNNYIFSTSLIMIGLGILLVNNLNLGFYNLLVLGVIFIGIHFFYNRHWVFSLIGSFLMTIGVYIILLLSHILPDGGEVAIVMATGMGFIVFYGIEGKWRNYWPLIPGLVVSLFGILIYLHQTEQFNFAFLNYVYRFWPLIIIAFGFFSLYSRNLKKSWFLFINKVNSKK